MPWISSKTFNTTIRQPAAEALELIAAHASELVPVWRRQVRAIGIEPEEVLDGLPLDFVRWAELLRTATYSGFRQGLQQFGERLSARGVSLHAIVCALNLLFEICIPVATMEATGRATPALALARLHGLVSLLTLSGYTGQWEVGKSALIETSIAEVEERRHQASAYVTRVYESERRKLSHDLHDEIGHDLILLKLYLEMMEMSLVQQNEDREALRHRIADAIAIVSHAIKSVRRLVLDLGPAVFEDLGFLPAVRFYISQFSKRTKIEVTFREGHLPADIPSTHQVALYRLLQGALSNVLKHAAAKHVKVSLGAMKGTVLIMVIEDDGVGFDVHAKPKSQSFGLTAMRERIEVLGGRIHIQSKPAAPRGQAHGTRIEVDLPLPEGVQQ